MGDQNKNHCCPYEGCNSSFNRPYRLNQHLLTHKNVRAYTCKEGNCSKSYTSKSHLDRHINTAHKKSIEVEVVYSCPTCMKTYANRQNLKRHMNINHTLRESFFCDSCNKQFRKKHLLSAHMYEHTGIRAFSCEICSTEFVYLHDKKRHMRCHKTYECPECLLVFNQWSQFQKHLKTDHVTTEYVCDICGRVFKQRNHMVRHVKLHDTTKTFPCPYEHCKRNTNLRQHILMKHEKFTYDCTICMAQLSTKVKLLEHIEKRHECTKPKIRIPKTKVTGRKPRKDIGVLKISTALKLAGFSNEPKKKKFDFSQKDQNLVINPSIM